MILHSFFIIHVFAFTSIIKTFLGLLIILCLIFKTKRGIYIARGNVAKDQAYIFSWNFSIQIEVKKIENKLHLFFKCRAIDLLHDVDELVLENSLICFATIRDKRKEPVTDDARQINELSESDLVN